MKVVLISHQRNMVYLQLYQLIKLLYFLIFPYFEMLMLKLLILVLQCNQEDDDEIYFLMVLNKDLFPNEDNYELRVELLYLCKHLLREHVLNHYRSLFPERIGLFTFFFNFLWFFSYIFFFFFFLDFLRIFVFL